MKVVQKVLLMGSVLIILTGCFNIPIGDGNKLRLSRDGVTITDDEGDQHSITIDEDEGQLHLEGFGMDEDDEGVSFGQNLTIPDSLPGDIPLPNDASVFQSMSVQGMITVVLGTNMNTNDVISLYEDYFNSQVFTSELSVVDYEAEGLLSKMLSANREDGHLMVTINSAEEGEEFNTMVSIALTPHENNE